MKIVIPIPSLNSYSTRRVEAEGHHTNEIIIVRVTRSVADAGGGIATISKILKRDECRAFILGLSAVFIDTFGRGDTLADGLIAACAAVAPAEIMEVK